MRRLGAIGTLVRDTNWHPSVLTAAGAPLEQWGGAVYSLSSLSAVCPPGWVVEPILKVGADLAPAALRDLAALPHLTPGAGLRVVPEPNNRVELRYHGPAERSERLTGGVPPWRWTELEPLTRPLDALYLNLISGMELELETAQRLRDAFPGLLYCDLHSLFLGPPGDAARPPRPLARWEEWAACCDVVQLNEAELTLLAGGMEPEAALARLIELGVRLVVVTLGPGGVRYAAAEALPADALAWPAHQSHARGVLFGQLPAPLGELPGDPTGCGDVWGAAFLAGLLEGLPLEGAISRAQRLAAAKMVHPDTSTLRDQLARAAAGALPA